MKQTEDYVSHINDCSKHETNDKVKHTTGEIIDRNQKSVDEPKHQEHEDDSKEHSEGAPINNFTFTFTSSEFALLLESRQSSGVIKFQRGWTDIFYNKFHSVLPTCAIKFIGNHLRRPDSRKHNTTFWYSRASCKAVAGCADVNFSIENKTDGKSDVIVNVTVKGMCQHSSSDIQPLHRRITQYIIANARY